jgi:hypothetical protein
MQARIEMSFGILSLGMQARIEMSLGGMCKVLGSKK